MGEKEPASTHHLTEPSEAVKEGTTIDPLTPVSDRAEPSEKRLLSAKIAWLDSQAATMSAIRTEEVTVGTTRDVAAEHDASRAAERVVESTKAQKKNTNIRQADSRPQKATAKRKKQKAKKASRKKKIARDESSSDSSDSDDESTTTSSDDEAAAEGRKKRKSSLKSKRALKLKAKRSRKLKKRDVRHDTETSADDDSGSDSESDATLKKKKKKTKVKSQKVTKSAAPKAETSASESESEADDTKDDIDALETQLADLLSKVGDLKRRSAKKRRASTTSSSSSRSRNKSSSRSPSKKSSRKGDSLKYKRVDQVWDNNTHNYALKESIEEDDSEFAEYAFLVRRRFNWENKYDRTIIDIKSRLLRLVLFEVMKDCKSINMSAEEPEVDPNMLFLYLEKLRVFYKKTLKARIKAEKKKKNIKKLEQQRALCKALVSYIDEDYESTKKTLYPLLEAGMITFDLLWALFLPNDIAITSSYGQWDEPRCFKVEYAMKVSSLTRGEWYSVEGKYMEYDGKNFGLGTFEGEVPAFKGPRKITSLAVFPLKYHKDPERMKQQIIERGRKFVGLQGMQYKFHQGIAFVKKKRQVLKININGRVMVDPATFRRINANYAVCTIKPKEDLYSDSEDESKCGSSDGDDYEDDDRLRGLDSDEDDVTEDEESAEEAEERKRIKWKKRKDDDGEEYYDDPVEVDENGDPIQNENLEQIPNGVTCAKEEFTDEQLLLTSSVVLGFAFSEKLWLEFSLSGIRDIDYNDKAFDSLVLPPDQKKTIHALVNSHKFHGARAIDDVIQGKGKGLVAVLHGPPGTGKTLTAEGISELLRCPLYCVSAGELGTDPGRLEQDLQRILDVAHSWGAVLLLDEADVFLERREVHDIHRNALVSIFLRLLEYFQGILFLTTNRVETFDDAFQSRIHVALKYGPLTTKARRTVWKMFLDLVRDTAPDAKIATFSDADLDTLSRKSLNGRQIKNMVRTAQAMALNEDEVLGMDHIRRVMDVSESFDRDLKGGTGYTDAMRSYT